MSTKALPKPAFVKLRDQLMGSANGNIRSEAIDELFDINNAEGPRDQQITGCGGLM